MSFTRRQLLGTAVGLPLMGVRAAMAQKAEFVLKYGNNLPVSHPMNLRANEMASKIAADSKGRIDFQVYPNNQLGNDTDMLSQLRSGALDFQTLSPLILGTLVPAAQISGVGFAFKDYSQVWAALDGELGAHVRRQIAATGTLFAMDKIWDNGYRQITTSTHAVSKPDDLKGMKIRIPPSPFWVSMFKAFDASPATINFAEVYSALQTKVVDAQENPLAIIATAKLNEVQKYITTTYHVHLQYAVIVNKKFWDGLPADIRAELEKAMDEATVYNNSIAQKENTDALAAIKATGKTEIHDPTPEEQKVWRAAMMPVYKSADGRGGKAIIDEALKATGQAQ